MDFRLRSGLYCRICNERLYHAISALPKKQRRRLVMYYFYDLTYEQIAMLEGCTSMPVKRSIDRAVKKLRKQVKGLFLFACFFFFMRETDIAGRK